MTFGGPETSGRGHSTIGLGAGTGVSLFPQAHQGGLGWFGRWRLGLTDRLDLGLDVLGAQYADMGAFTGKLALRGRIHRLVSLEVGAGGDDDSRVRSVHADGAVIAGGELPGSRWSLYGAARVAGAIAVTSNVEGDSGETLFPHAVFAFGTLGAAARLSDWARFIAEAGMGYIGVAGGGLPRDGLGIYVGVGVLFRLKNVR
jgi:hypothetical protein